MHCPSCIILATQRNWTGDLKDPTMKRDPKARVIKTETHRTQTHRIYRCPDKNCDHTFHTIEIPRQRFRELEEIEKRAQAFARLLQQ